MPSTSLARLFNNFALGLCVILVGSSILAPLFTPLLPPSLPVASLPHSSEATAAAAVSGDREGSPCFLPASRLLAYGLSDEVEVACSILSSQPKQGPSTSHDEVQQQLPTPIDEELWGDSTLISLATLQSQLQADQTDVGGIEVDPQQVRHLSLPISPLQLPPSGVRGKEFVFGVATSVDRLRERAEQIRLWLAGTEALLVVNLPPEDRARMRELSAHLSALRIRATVFVSEEADFLARYLELVALFGRIRQRPHRWYTLIDDDTFYLSLDHLAALLAPYDPAKRWYIGGITEDWRQIIGVKLIAFGGAGVILSSPLVDALVPHYHECRSAEGPGDSRLAQCVYAHTQTKLSIETSLRQGDLLGDVHGLLESGRRTTSLHHWSTWFQVNVTAMLPVAQICTPGCLLQRFSFPSSRPSAAIGADLRRAGQRWNPFGGGADSRAPQPYRAVLTNGYDIVVYPASVYETLDLARMERTWNVEPGSNFEHSLAPLREPLDEGRQRFTYQLRDSWAERAGQRTGTVVKQVYVRKGGEQKDHVVLLAWTAST